MTQPEGTPRTDARAMGFRRQTIGAVESAIEWAKELERELATCEAQAYERAAKELIPQEVRTLMEDFDNPCFGSQIHNDIPHRIGLAMLKNRSLSAVRTTPQTREAPNG